MQRKRYYILRSPQNRFFAYVEVMSSLQHKVIVGGKKKCVVISVYHDGTHPNIDSLSYDERCNSSATLERGRGTKDMVLSAMSLVHTLYGHTQFELKDRSYVKCEQSYEIPLMYLYLAKHGKTWYEDHFGARPIKIKDYDIKVKNLKRLLKEYPAWSQVCEQYDVPQKFRKALGALYRDVKSLKDFIRLVSSEYDCYMCKQWLGNIIEHVMEQDMLGTSWIISHTPDSKFMNIEEIERLPDDMLMHVKGQAGGADEMDLTKDYMR